MIKYLAKNSNAGKINISIHDAIQCGSGNGCLAMHAFTTALSCSYRIIIYVSGGTAPILS